MDARPSDPAAPGRRAGAAAAIAVALTPLLAGAGRYETRNFAVEAPTADAARQVGEHAETCRKAIAMAWLGRELPAWSARCPVKVVLTDGEAGGLTSFGFAREGVSDQSIKVEGRLDRILASALPHEVTHTIFAAYLGGPMPRWADEGASLLSEDNRELRRHDGIAAGLLSRRAELPLGQLFRVEEYPADLMGFYGQGYSVARFLVEAGGRPTFLRFVRDGMKSGWDAAARAHYGLADCRELDRAWHSWHRVNAEARVASNPAAGGVTLRAQSPSATR